MIRERNWVEVNVAYFKVIPQKLSGGDKKITKIFSQGS
jgi:hypothetical protein